MTEHHRAPHLLHTEVIAIRWGDMDAMRHVNNTVYFRFMEQARIGWLDSLRDALIAEGAGTVVASTTCNFRRPFTYPGTVEANVSIGRIGRSSISTLYEMRLQGGTVVHADGEATIVWINMASGRAVRVPLAIRHRLGGTQTA